MNQQIEQILERPTSHKVIILVGSLLFLSYIFWQFFFKDLLEESERLEKQQAKLSSELVTELRLSRDLPKVKEQVKELDAMLQKVLRELPDKKEIPDLLSSISSLAREAGLEVDLFRPQGERIRDFYAEVPVAVSITGTYHQIGSFFDEVGRLDRIVNINGINMREPKVSPEAVNLKSSCTITTFRYLDEAERQAVEDAKNSKKKRRR